MAITFCIDTASIVALSEPMARGWFVASPNKCFHDPCLGSLAHFFLWIKSPFLEHFDRVLFLSLFPFPYMPFKEWSACILSFSLSLLVILNFVVQTMGLSFYQPDVER